MKISFIFLLFIISSLVSLSYGRGSKKPQISIPPKDQNDLRVLSYNTGLAYGYIPYEEFRRDQIIDRLKKSEADVICLQEVWRKKDQKLIISQLKKDFPYYLKTDFKQSRERGLGSTCKYKDIFGEGKFATCRLSCGSKDTPEEVKECENKCTGLLYKLAKTKPKCAEGLIGAVGKNPVMAILSLLNPFRKAGRFVYKGNLGTILLSKYPMIEDRTLIQDMAGYSTGQRRGALFSTLDLGRGKYAVVGCTHLTANLSHDAPHVGNLPITAKEARLLAPRSEILDSTNKWEVENLYQVKRLAEFSQVMAALPDPKNPNRKMNALTFLMGDFNCGLGRKEIEKRGNKVIDPHLKGDFENSCLFMEKLGHLDPISYNNKARCTFCSIEGNGISQNTLLEKSPEGNLLLDHIFVGGKEKDRYIYTSDVVFTERVESEAAKRAINLSDHFGVLVNVKIRGK